ncbi:MAG: MoaD/ThiS family protein [Pirellulaceae bacterium]|nr:MoaD/ThiS family protein [Pirellulaceae bacterium]
MPQVVFTSNLRQHLELPELVVEGQTVRQALEAVFAEHQRLRGYVLDEQNRLRTHMVIFVDGRPIKDRERLSDPVRPDSQLYVMQALSGG